MSLCQGITSQIRHIPRKALLKQVFLACVMAMGNFAAGTVLGYTSCAIPSMQSNSSSLYVTDEQASWMTSLMPLGSLVGNLVATPMFHMLGRKGMLMWVCGPGFIISWALIAGAVHVVMLYIGRFIAGACVGVTYAASPLYIVETADINIRGGLASFASTIGSVGTLFSFIIGMYVDWVWLAVVSLILCVPFFVFLLFAVPESPQWLLKKGQDERAKHILLLLRGSEVAANAQLIQLEVEDEINEHLGGMKVLKQWSVLRAFLVTLGLMVFQQFSGIAAVNYYTVQIFQEAGSTVDAYVATVIIGAVQLVGSCISALLIERSGRKPLLIFSSVLMTISLGALGAYFYLQSENNAANLGWLPLVSLVLYIAAFMIGYGPLAYIMTPEILPPSFRVAGTPLTVAFNALCAFIVSKTFTDLSDLLHNDGIFWLYTGVCAVGIVFGVLFVPETKGKSAENIKNHFTKGCCCGLT